MEEETDYEVEEEFIEYNVDSDIEEGQIRETYYLQKVPQSIGVICWNLNGYTITNGVECICRDETDGNAIHDDLEQLRIERLYVVESVRPIQFPNVFIMDPLHPVAFPKCPTCHSIMCHRWKAFEGGLQKLVHYKVFCIPH